MNAVPSETPWPMPAADALPADGRRARSHSSRRRIIAALLELVEQGDVSPSAARVAERAGVGLRTVFRHFDDMDSLYQEMTGQVAARVAPLIGQPLPGEGWKDRMRALAARRAQVYDMIMPFRISASVKRFQSPFLLQEYRRMLRLERSTIVGQLPKSVADDAVTVEALHASLGFQTWRLLRHDESLDTAIAAAAVRRLLDAVLVTLPD